MFVQHLLRRARHCIKLTPRLTPASYRRSSTHLFSLCDRGYSSGGGGQVTKEKQHVHSCLQPSTVKISGAIKLPASSMVQVAWGDGETDVYPYVWLRDHCQCPNCFHPITKSRIMSLGDLHLAISPTSIQVVEEGRRVEVGWSDGHLGTYPASWLHQRSFNTHQFNLRDETVRLKQKLWGCELSEDLPGASFPELLENDWALLAFLQQLEVMGLVLISHTPAQTKQCQLLSQRVTYCSRTYYGETFIVHNKTDPNNLAYTPCSLDLHSDLPCLSYKPNVQLLHCISQFEGDGGDNLFVDSLRAAAIFRSVHPDKFNLLVKTPVVFNDIGVEDGQKFHIVNQTPIICLDEAGDITTVNINNMSRDFINLAAADVAGWYEALFAFRDILNHPQNCISYKLKPGDIIVLDNMRVLHGRKGFNSSSGDRLLEGCYWDWDMVRSKRRVLQANLVTP